MWLPPLRPVLPDGAPVGISLGAFKPQRDIEHEFWPGPTSVDLSDWGEWVEIEEHPRVVERPRGPLATALAVILG